MVHENEKEKRKKKKREREREKGREKNCSEQMHIPEIVHSPDTRSVQFSSLLA